MSYAADFPENRVSAHFTWALVVSFALHILALTALHPFNFSAYEPVNVIDVKLSPPEPPPAPPPEPPKPKMEEPPKPAPPIKRLPEPVRREPPPAPIAPAEVMPEPAPRMEPVPPTVISVPQKPAEQPAFVAPPPPPPLPEPPKNLVTQDMDAARGYYSSQLSKEFAKHKQYPRVAQMRGWQGTVQVQVQMDASGTVMSSSISQSSGYEALDKQALEMVQKASPLPRPPEALRDREFTVLVPVVFRLE